MANELWYQEQIRNAQVLLFEQLRILLKLMPLPSLPGAGNPPATVPLPTGIPASAHTEAILAASNALVANPTSPEALALLAQSLRIVANMLEGWLPPKV